MPYSRLISSRLQLLASLTCDVKRKVSSERQAPAIIPAMGAYFMARTSGCGAAVNVVKCASQSCSNLMKAPRFPIWPVTSAYFRPTGLAFRQIQGMVGAGVARGCWVDGGACRAQGLRKRRHTWSQ